MINHGSELI
jgi:hypothetical protein